MIVFLIHVVFLAFGMQQIKIALDMFEPELLAPSQLRLDHVIQAVYMVTIAFSILLLILAVFVLEIFRTQRRIINHLMELKEAQEKSESTSSNRTKP